MSNMKDNENQLPGSFQEEEDSHNEAESNDGGEVDADEEEREQRKVVNSDVNMTWKQICTDQVFLDPPTAITCQKPAGCTRLVIISDTHGTHRSLFLPPGDVLIQGGDFTNSGEVGIIRDLALFFQESGFQEVIAIAGNHDMTLQQEFYTKNWSEFHATPLDADQAQKAIREHCIYLQDSMYTTNSGLGVYGSPYAPLYDNWSFEEVRGPPIRKIWDQIPSDGSVDVLITHSPPLGRGDETRSSDRAGCHDLLMVVQETVKPRVHVFGHIHEGYGTYYDGHVLYVNACSVNVTYDPVNYPIVVDVPHVDKSQPARIVRPNCTVQSKEAFTEWCRQHKHIAVAEALDGCDQAGADFPSGNDLFFRDSYLLLGEMLHMNQSPEGSQKLLSALAALYAASFHG